MKAGIPIPTCTTLLAGLRLFRLAPGVGVHVSNVCSQSPCVCVCVCVCVNVCACVRV